MYKVGLQPGVNTGTPSKAWREYVLSLKGFKFKYIKRSDGKWVLVPR